MRCYRMDNFFSSENIDSNCILLADSQTKTFERGIKKMNEVVKEPKDLARKMRALPLNPRYRSFSLLNLG